MLRADGRHVDVEMQAALHPGLIQRILYYWARLYGSQLSPGDGYGQLCPCISIVFVNSRLLPTPRFHGTFRVLEVHDHFELTDALELHLVEWSFDHSSASLPKRVPRDADPRLARWVRFLLAESCEELQELAMNDADMQRAKDALDQLSDDPTVRELARQRELSRANLAIIRSFERQEGRQEGRAEGLADGLAVGRVDGLRLAIEALCDVLEIEMTGHHRQLLAQLGNDGLQDLLDGIRRERRWPGSD